MSDVVISCEVLGKSYLIGHEGRRERYTALRDVIARHGRNLWNRTRQALRGQTSVSGQDVEEFWALKDVSFEVKRGEVVGIIGRNGAGKSTLLKILSRITEPTEGRVTLRGRVASLLEVGTGFHPELTGRENVFLNGAILGMSRAEIKRKFDEIVAFAEVEKFLDTPVKRYSSGMYVRLAFAVAAHLEPEILVIDEVLAVGDAEFQQKCLGKMQDVAAGGRTVLFVSHNMAALSRLCPRSLLLKAGRIVMSGETRNLVSAHLIHDLEVVDFRPATRVERLDEAPVRLVSARLSCEQRTGTSKFAHDDELVLRLEYECAVHHPKLRVGFRLHSSDGTVLFTSTSTDRGNSRAPACSLGGTFQSECRIPPCLLNFGQYSITVTCDIPNQTVCFIYNGALSFSIEPGLETTYAEEYRLGALTPSLHWANCIIGGTESISRVMAHQSEL
jgi:lipopolysaccharide transport system ATP-binding protein